MTIPRYPTTIATERLFIAPLSARDAAFIFELLNTETWVKHIGNRNINSQEEASTYIQKINENPKVLYWTVKLKENRKRIGVVTLIQRDYLSSKDIGFAFLPAFCSKGYAFEATQAVMQNLPEKSILAITSPDNQPSIKLIEKLGLKFENTIVQDQEKLLLYRKDL